MKPCFHSLLALALTSGTITAITATQPALGQNSFTVTRLGWLPGDDTFKLSRGVSLNATAQVVGGSSGRSVTLSNGGRLGGFLFGFEWDATNGMQYVFDTVYPNSAFTSYTVGINDNGSLIGFYSALNGSGNGYFRFTDGTAIPLLPLQAGASVFPRKLNNLNQIVGQSFSQSTRLTTPVLWNANGVPIALSVPGGGAIAYGLNDVGQVVGEGNVNSTQPSLPFLWDSINGGRTLPYLGVGGGARSISGNSTVAGYVELLPGHMQDHAALWSGGTLADIHRFGVKSIAVDINDAGQAVGAFGSRDENLYFDSFHPYSGFYYDGSRTRNLIAMTDESLPYTHLLPYAINSSGQIAAEGFVAVEVFPGVFGIRSAEAVLLTPSDVVLPTPQEITNQLGITISAKPRYNPVSKLWERVLTLKNLSRAPLAGPLKATLSTPGAAFLTSPQAMGKTQVAEPLGSSYYVFNIPNGTLAPGASLDVVFSFSLPALRVGTDVTITHVYSGAGRL